MAEQFDAVPDETTALVSWDLEQDRFHIALDGTDTPDDQLVALGDAMAKILNRPGDTAQWLVAPGDDDQPPLAFVVIPRRQQSRYPRRP